MGHSTGWIFRERLRTAPQHEDLRIKRPLGLIRYLHLARSVGEWIVRSLTDVDCSSRSGQAVHLHRACCTHPGSEPDYDLAHTDRYFPEHRYPCDCGCMAVHGHESRRTRRAADEHV